jgi:hypothetical protein
LANTLQEELLAIPGIAGAEIEGERDHPQGVRVQLAAGADADHVGREVQRVLAAHGMRSQLSREDEGLVPQGSVVNLADYEDEVAVDEPAAGEISDDLAPAEEPGGGDETSGVDESAEPELVVGAERDSDRIVPRDATEAELEVLEGPPPQITVPSVTVDDIDAMLDVESSAGPIEAAAVPPFVTDAGEVEAEGDVATEAAVAAPRDTSEATPAAEGLPADELVGVAVEEQLDRVVVTVRTQRGTSVAQAGPPTPDGITTAAALAAAAAASPDAAPRIVSISGSEVGGSHVVNVVFEVGFGERRAGAAVVRGSRAAAVARAAWAAMRG